MEQTILAFFGFPCLLDKESEQRTIKFDEQFYDVELKCWIEGVTLNSQNRVLVKVTFNDGSQLAPYPLNVFHYPTRKAICSLILHMLTQKLK